jgi:hypothetical protein
MMRAVLEACRASLFALLPLLLVVGCGRIGFDSLPASGAEEDASFAQQDATYAQQDATLVDASFAQQDAAPLDITNPPSLAGIWSADSLTPDLQSTPIPRAVNGDGVLGEFELISTGDTTFDFKGASIILNNNLPIDLKSLDGTMAIQPDEKWLMLFDGTEVMVVIADLDGDLLTLTWDESDPRNNLSFTPPLATALKRNYDFATTSAGDWNSLSIEYRDGDVFTPGGCVSQGGGEYERIDMDWHLDSILRTTINVHWRLYSDASCQNLTSADTEVFIGIGQEDGTRMQFWGGEASFGPVYVDTQLSFPGANMRALVTNCEPSACLDLSEDHLLEPASF